MNQAQVQRRINEFQRRFSAYGDAAMHLAYHAALPVALNPDLIHLLRINFFLDPPERLPYSIEFEFLLSSLCRQVDEGLYEIEPDIRAELLEGLSAEYDGERIEEIATLLWQYVDHYAPWGNRVGLERAQQLTALNFLDIAKAQQWLDEAESQTRTGASTEREWFLVMRAAVEKAGAVKEKARKQRSDSQSSTQPFMVPSLPEHYVDRPKVIALLKQQLLGTLNHNEIFISGKAGTGKTTIAIAIASAPEVRARFSDGILWTSSKQDTKKSLLAWLQSLGKMQGDNSRVEGVTLSVTALAEQVRALLKNRKILLVIDDVENSSEIEPFDIGGPMCCTIVITARKIDLNAGYITQLKSMTLSQAMSLLEKNVGTELINEKRDEFAELAKSLEYLPLALLTAAKQVEAGYSVEDIINLTHDENSDTKDKEEQWNILVLASSPNSTSTLSLDKEVRDIDTNLAQSRYRDKFSLHQRWAFRPRDLQRALLEISPQIVHFYGHGAGDTGIALEDSSGNPKLVSNDALASLFELYADQVQCVVLSGCYTETQANAIAQHIPYVIGLQTSIGDQGAIEFLIGFYDGLGAGRDIEFAFKLGCSAIELAGFNEPFEPILIQQPTSSVDNITEPDPKLLKLTSAQRRQLSKTIRSVYRSWSELAIFVDFELGEDLSAIVSSDRSFSASVFNLIKWAEAKGRTADLVRAIESDTSNPEVKQFLNSILQSEPAVTSDPLDDDVAEAEPDSLELTKTQRKQLLERMLADYPSRRALEVFVDYELDKNLSEITNSSSLHEDAFQLVQWVTQQGRIKDFIQSLKSDTKNLVSENFYNSILTPDKGTSDESRSESIEVFVSSSHREQEIKDELVIHVKELIQQSKFRRWAWCSRTIEPGREWDNEIIPELESADIILLLITPDFVTSDYCYGREMQRAMERHEEGTARVVPIIIEPCDWQEAPFSKLNALPTNAKPIRRWEDQDEAFLNVIEGLQKVIDSMQK